MPRAKAIKVGGGTRRLNFKPTAKQQELHELIFSQGNDEILYGGARGGAKTIGCVWIAWEWCVIFPGIRIVVVRRDFNDLKSTTMREFEIFLGRYHPEIQADWVRTSPAECRVMVGGATSTVVFAESKDPISLRSQNAAALIIEEATEVSEAAYLEISAALGRSLVEVALVPEQYRGLLTDEADGLAHPPTRILLAANPGPSWIKKEFPIGDGRVRARRKTSKAWTDFEGLEQVSSITRIFLPSFPRDNPHLPKTWESNLRAKYGDDYAARMLDGNWNVFEGQIFGEFDPLPGRGTVVSQKQIDAEQIPLKAWTHIRAVDWGFRNPLAALIVSIDFAGNFWVWREYRAAGRTPAQHAPYLADLVRDLPYQIDIMDPAAVDQSSGVQIKDQFNFMTEFRFNFMGWSKRKHGVDGSITFTKKLLQEGKLFIAEGCAGLIREMMEARWKPQTPSAEEKSNPVEEMMDKDDHSLDSFFGAVERWRQKPYEPTKKDGFEDTRRIMQEAGVGTARNFQVLKEMNRRDREGEGPKKRMDGLAHWIR